MILKKCDVCGSLQKRESAEFTVTLAGFSKFRNYELCQDCAEIMVKAFNGMCILKDAIECKIPCEDIESSE